MADKVYTPGISTLGARVGYAVETTAGVKPTSFKLLHRVNAIGGIGLDVETIDASALEDLVEKSVAGRASSGGNFSVTVNITDDTITEWTTLISAYVAAKATGKNTWFQITFPNLAQAFFVTAEPPQQIPMPAVDQNGLLTVEMTMIINSYEGPATKIAMSEQTA